MSVTTLHNTPATQADDISDRVNRAKIAFEAADALVEDVANNIAAYRYARPNEGGSFGPSSGMCYVMSSLRSELETLEQEVEQLRAQLKGDLQAGEA